MEQDVFQQRLEEDRKLVEEAAHRVCQGWRRYADLTEAMEYSLLAGGSGSAPCWCWRPAACAAEIRSGRCHWPAEWR